jgi:hypothetical protein
MKPMSGNKTEQRSDVLPALPVPVQTPALGTSALVIGDNITVHTNLCSVQENLI